MVVLVRLPQLLLLRRGRRVVRVVLRPQLLPEKAWTQTRDGINYHQIPTPLLFDRGREKNNMKEKKNAPKNNFFKTFYFAGTHFCDYLCAACVYFADQLIHWPPECR